MAAAASALKATVGGSVLGVGGSGLRPSAGALRGRRLGAGAARRAWGSELPDLGLDCIIGWPCGIVAQEECTTLVQGSGVNQPGTSASASPRAATKAPHLVFYWL